MNSNLIINDFYKKKVKKISEGIAKNIKRKINKFTGQFISSIVKAASETKFSIFVLFVIL